jgi:GH15 family glucan-1,4-alpha-glucosidase
VALQRLLELAENGHVPDREHARWQSERDAIRSFIDETLFSPARSAYVMRDGSEDLDCAVLLAARRGYLPGGDERLHGTIDAIAGELDAGGPLLYRYSGMREQENAFLACSFWLVEALAIAGRTDEAARRMVALMVFASDVGLYSEELDPATGELRGNLPQALTHLALVNAAVILARCQSRA